MVGRKQTPGGRGSGKKSEFRPEEQLYHVSRVLRKQATLEQVGQELGLHPSTISLWKKRILEEAVKGDGFKELVYEYAEMEFFGEGRKRKPPAELLQFMGLIWPHLYPGESSPAEIKQTFEVVDRRKEDAPEEERE